VQAGCQLAVLYYYYYCRVIHYNGVLVSRGLTIGLAVLLQGKQAPLVVKAKFGRPPDKLSEQVFGM